jgi:hypothetical protein
VTGNKTGVAWNCLGSEVTFPQYVNVKQFSVCVPYHKGSVSQPQSVVLGEHLGGGSVEEGGCLLHGGQEVEGEERTSHQI